MQHVVGRPWGLLLTALLQSMRRSTPLYEKRREYTRTRMVQFSPYLVADSVESYRADAIDGDSVEAIFDPTELDQALAFDSPSLVTSMHSCTTTRSHSSRSCTSTSRATLGIQGGGSTGVFCLLPREAGLEQETPTFDEAPARVDQPHQEH